MPCGGGQYISADGCKSCDKDTYSAGGFEDRCIACPDGKTVAAGQGTQISDCYGKYSEQHTHPGPEAWTVPYY